MKRSWKLKLFLITGIFILQTFLLLAHSGRTDSNGGHYNRKTGRYHYHGVRGNIVGVLVVAGIIGIGFLVGGYIERRRTLSTKK